MLDTDDATPAGAAVHPSPQVTPPADEPPWLSPDEQAAWLGAAALVFTVPGALDSQLQRESGIGLFEYMVMSSLSMSPERTARMSQLAELTNGSLSRLSNVVKRLEQRSWVVRRPDPTDGRFTVAWLTDDGWAKVVSAAPGHVRAVRHFVLDPLTRTQVRQLADIGPRIRQRAHTAPPAVEGDACRPEC